MHLNILSSQDHLLHLEFDFCWHLNMLLTIATLTSSSDIDINITTSASYNTLLQSTCSYSARLFFFSHYYSSVTVQDADLDSKSSANDKCPCKHSSILNGDQGARRAGGDYPQNTGRKTEAMDDDSG